MQTRVQEFQEAENTSFYHHELHKKIVKKASILRLDIGTEVIEGHEKCADYLEKTVEDLLANEAQLDKDAQEILLNEVEEVFTEEDNTRMTMPPHKQGDL